MCKLLRGFNVTVIPVSKGRLKKSYRLFYIQVGFALVVTIIWAALYIRHFLNPSFPPPEGMLPLLMLVAGYLLGDRIVKAVKNGDIKKEKNGA